MPNVSFLASSLEELGQQLGVQDSQPAQAAGQPSERSEDGVGSPSGHDADHYLVRPMGLQVPVRTAQIGAAFPGFLILKNKPLAFRAIFRDFSSPDPWISGYVMT